MILTLAKLMVFSLSGCFPAVVAAHPGMGRAPMSISGSFELGQHTMDNSGVNTQLSRNGAGQFDDMNTTIGGSAYVILNRRLLLGVEGAGFWQSTSGPDAKAKIEGGYGFFDLGLVPVHRRNLLIYPMLGIGGGGAKLRFRSRTGNDFVFGDEVFYEHEEPGFGVFAMNFSLGAEYRLELFKSRRHVGGLNLSMRTGYIWLPFESDWRVYDFEIFGSPPATFAGPYARLGIGLWGSNRRRTHAR
ncbi:MAG: hypothetical protein ACE5JA_04225 [bacterium]